MFPRGIQIVGQLQAGSDFLEMVSQPTDGKGTRGWNQTWNARVGAGGVGGLVQLVLGEADVKVPP